MKKKFLFANFYLKNLIFFLFLCLFSFSLDVAAKETISVEEGRKLLQKLKIEKQRFLTEISDIEDDCLKIFLSGPCLERLIIKHDSQIREYELQKQNILIKVRRFEADLRRKKRKKKASD